MVEKADVAKLYVATFNRAPDDDGLDYWTSSDFSIELIAKSFFDQSETQALYPEDMSNESFVIAIYKNLFDRLPDTAGYEYWVEALDNGTVTRDVAILSFINGAQDTELYKDATILANKTTVGLYYADQGGEGDDFSLANVDATDDSVTNAQAAVDSSIAVSTDYELTADTDRITGSAGNDSFEAAITQNPWAGGVSNSLSTADRLDGGAGTDTLHAELVPEFYGVTGDNVMDVQPRIKSIEDIQFEALDVFAGNLADPDNAEPDAVITVDAKNITDVVKIGSSFSDGDLVIENLTTLTSAGAIRNTEDITITMDHTDNFNSDTDASDLTVYFDEDYLVSGQTSEASAHYFLLDEDAELNGLDNRLNRINVDGIRFVLGDADPTDPANAIEISDPDTLTAGTHEAFVAALQDELQALIDDGTLPAGSTLTLDPSITDTTGLDDGSISNLIPAIVLTTGDGTTVTPIGYSQVEDILGNYDVYGQFSAESQTNNNPITVNVELEKVGRDGEGGNLVIGGKDQNNNGNSDVDKADGIAVFNIAVNGDDDQPSNLGTVSSTNNSLRTVNISDGADWDGAELTIRNLLGEGQELTLINAIGFSGDFSLAMGAGSQQALTSNFGSGNDSYDWMSSELDGVSSGKDYSISMGAGNDTVIATLDGDSVDTIGESFSLNAGTGNDRIFVDGPGFAQTGVSQQTMNLLDNLSISAGAGDDYVNLENNYRFDINAGAGSDFVYIDSTDSGAAVGTWTFSTATGPATFVDRVLYKAELTVTFAGFESTVAVDTDAAGNFIADQVTINTAIKAAIAANPELVRLLSVTDGTGEQALTITSTVDGINELDIDLYQPELVASGGATVAGQVNLSTSDETALLTGIIDTDATQNSATDPLTYVNGIDGSLTNTGAVGAAGLWDGETVNLSNSFLNGAASGTDATGAANVNFSTVNMANGSNDLLALDSNDDSGNVLVIDQNFGKVSVVNFFDDAARTVVGDHALDYTHYLNNQTDATANGNSLSAVDIAVTLDTTLDPTTVATIDANEVKMIRFSETATETFDNLSATALVTALNGDGTATDNYGNINNAIDAVASTATLVGNVQNHIFMVENANNLGEYKVFHLTSTVDTTSGTTDGDFDTSAVELGTVDFGASINFGLVGSAAWEAAYDARLVAADAGDIVTIDTYTDAELTTLDNVGLLPAAYHLEDTATDVAGSIYLNGATNVTANDEASVAEAVDIDAATNTGTTTYDIEDVLSTIAFVGSSTAVTNAGTVTGQATNAQDISSVDLTAIDTLGVFATGSITLTAAQFNSGIIIEDSVGGTLAGETLNFTTLTGATVAATLADDVFVFGASDTGVSITGFDTTNDALDVFGASGLIDAVLSAGTFTDDFTDAADSNLDLSVDNIGGVITADGTIAASDVVLVGDLTTPTDGSDDEIGIADGGSAVVAVSDGANGTSMNLYLVSDSDGDAANGTITAEVTLVGTVTIDDYANITGADFA